MDDESCIHDLSNFVITKILAESGQRKQICVQGKFKDSEDASILILEKKAFTEDNVRLLCNDKSIFKKQFINDVYFSYEFFPPVELNGIKATIINPATAEHIKKFERTSVHIVEETKDTYHGITLPHILQRQLSLQWVYNILDHKSEAERIIYEDNHPQNGFILLPDLKWDGKQIETLYLLAICNSRNIKSIRDLRADHLPLLNNILTQGSKTIEEKYGISRSKLRIYLHYPPSFYHLHVHFTFIEFEAPGIYFERAHSLTSVINNIQVVGDYYSRSVILFPIRETDELFEKFKESGLIDSAEKKRFKKNENSISKNTSSEES